MSENKPEVQITSAPTETDQFGQISYLTNKPQSRKKIIVASILVVLSLSTFFGGQRKQVHRKALGLKTPRVQSTGPAVLPNYSRIYDMSREKPKVRAQAKRVEVFSGPQVVKRPFSDQILPGIMIKAKLVSGASDGLVKAVATESLEALGNEVIPTGSIFVGIGSSGKHRLQVRFREVVFPDGSVQKIRAVGADFSDKISGLKGSKLGHYGLKLAAGAGLNFAAGLAQGLREREVIGGVPTEKTDLRNAALNGTSQASLEIGKEVLAQMKADKPVIVIKAETPIYILFSGQ